jgi:putative endonuclease
MEYGGWVYMLTNRFRTVVYIGVTSDLLYRLWQHREKLNPKSFSAQYKTDLLVYYEFFDSIEAAIAREKQLKGFARSKKDKLINNFNPGWEDLTYRL